MWYRSPQDRHLRLQLSAILENIEEGKQQKGREKRRELKGGEFAIETLFH